MLKLTQAARFLSTVKYLRTKQIFYRVVYFFKKRLLKKFLINEIIHRSFESIPTINSLASRAITGSGCDLKKKEFIFINHNVIFPEQIEWNDPRQEKLWLYNLHYFDFLQPLTQNPSRENFDMAKKIIWDWIENNPVGRGNGWEPYTLSLRIFNWLYFYTFYRSAFSEDEIRDSFLHSLYRQAHYLFHFIEFHILANHLLTNLKALFCAGLFFSEKRWIDNAGKMLLQELDEQILADGGHYERSPMYHAIIINDLIDILNFIEHFDNSAETKKITGKRIGPVKKKLEGLIPEMFNWLRTMRHPDGDIALFGDSAFGIAPDYIDLKNYFSRLAGKAIDDRQEGPLIDLPESGYAAFREKGHCLIFDGGELGVSYQPGHAHCDLLSFEYAYDGKRFIVDTGVGNYRETDLRQHARSIYAHNTVVVNGLDQAQIWKAFRMGKRVVPEGKLQADKKLRNISAAYTNRLSGSLAYRHERHIHFTDKRFIFFEDRIEAENIISVEILFHLHPDCHVEVQADAVHIKRESSAIALIFDPIILQPSIREGFYTPEFGKILESPIIVFKPQQGHEKRFGCLITPLDHLEVAKAWFSEHGN